MTKLCVCLQATEPLQMAWWRSTELFFDYLSVIFDFIYFLRTLSKGLIETNVLWIRGLQILIEFEQHYKKKLVPDITYIQNTLKLY